jgi:hypothetical protein
VASRAFSDPIKSDRGYSFLFLRVLFANAGPNVRVSKYAPKEAVMGRGILLFLLGVPIPVIILIALLYR